MKRATVLINPISGGGRTPHPVAAHAALARTTLGQHGFDAHVHVTRWPRDAYHVAREAVSSGIDLVVAWGGDGTMNEVASALAFGPVPMALVPSGSGNGLARELGLPTDPVRALTIAAGNAVRLLDAGEIDGSLFFNVAGIGLDAAIAERFAKRAAGHRGLAAYAQLVALELLQWRARSYVLTFNGSRFDQRALMITFANSRQYGNGAVIAPRALLDDGLIDVVVVGEQSIFRIAAQLPALFRGTLQESRGLLMRAVRHAEIAAEGQLAFHVDGEPRAGRAVLRVRVRPQALRVRTPVAH